jgi:hypothetical protein
MKYKEVKYPCPQCSEGMFEGKTYQGCGIEIPVMICDSCKNVIDCDDYFEPDSNLLIDELALSK